MFKNTYPFNIVLLVTLLLVFPIKLSAIVKTGAIFSDNMVLQQNSEVKIWGSADAGEKVTVMCSWDNKPYYTVASSDGKWQLKLKTGANTTDQSLSIQGEDNKILIKNILIGEVWLCTGQSNMEFPMGKDSINRWKTGVINEAEELNDADYPQIRVFKIEHQLSPNEERDDCVGKWEIVNAESVKDFSAVGFMFGRKLFKELKTPIGLIQSTWGGTHAESWTKMSVMKGNPFYNDVLTDFPAETTSSQNKVPSTLWNGMIAPIVGYTIKGNIWYQGESNSIRHEKYQKVFSNLINSWRKEWSQPNMPFYYVQITPHYKQPPEIREAQLNTWKKSNLQNVGMVVTTDVGDSTDIHPRNKKVVGERLAYWALANQYGYNNISYSGPIYKSMKVKGEKVIVDFEFTKGGLKTPNGEPLTGFFVAGKDELFYSANAEIVGNTVVLSSSDVSKPIAVRYGFDKFFRVNLYNGDGLPASPFRTDSFIKDDYFSCAKRFAESEMIRFPKAYQLDHGKRLFWGYAQGVGTLSMLKMWKITGDDKYFNYVEEWADSLINDDGDIHLYTVETYNIDFINSGKILFDLYNKTKNKKYKLAMDLLVKQMKNHPRTLEGGYWHKLIYQHQIWLDGIYMASPFLAQYGKEFKQPEWIDEAVKQISICHKNTFDPNTGLYHHAWDESMSQAWANPDTGHSPNFWGRSIGWWFMAMVDALDYIPKDHKGYNNIVTWINGLAESLIEYQDEDGLWYQVIDQPEREGNFPEASVTTQLMYSYAKAVNKGYINREYGVYAQKAFNGLKKELLIENPEDGTLTLTQCCQVGGLGGNPYRDGSFEYYINEKMRDNDAKATGPFIMGCLELSNF